MTRTRGLRAIAVVTAFALVLPAIAQSDPARSTPRRERLRQAMAGDLEDGTADDRCSREAPTGTRIAPNVTPRASSDAIIAP